MNIPHLHYFHFLAIRHNDAVSPCMQFFQHRYMSSLTQDRCPGMKLLKCMVNVCLTLSKLSNCFQISHIILYFHRNIGFLTPHILDSICYLFVIAMLVGIRASLVAQLVKNHLQCRRLWFNPWPGRPPGEGIGYPLQYTCLENPHELRSLAGYSLRGCKQSDTAERPNTAQHAKEAKK